MMRYAPWQRVCAQAAGQMVGVRHPGERETLQMAVDMVRAARAADDAAKEAGK